MWVADPQAGFVKAVVTGTRDDCLVLQVPHRGEVPSPPLSLQTQSPLRSRELKVTVKAGETFPVNPAHLDMVEDMGDLSELSEAAVLHNLRSRYAHHHIYVWFFIPALAWR